MTPRVKEILSWYGADNPGTLSSLARILNHGRLGGTGKLVILPVDQGFEHGPARSFAPNPPAYPGPSAATQQRAAYPDIVPIVINAPPADAFRKVDEVALAMGWEVVARAPADGRIEATDTSDWFGLTDDGNVVLPEP